MLTRIPDWKIDEANSNRLNAIETANTSGFATLNDLNNVLIDLIDVKATLTTLDVANAGATDGEVVTLLGLITADVASLTTALNTLTDGSTTSATAIAAARAPLAPIY